MLVVAVAAPALVDLEEPLAAELAVVAVVVAAAVVAAAAVACQQETRHGYFAVDGAELVEQDDWPVAAWVAVPLAVEVFHHVRGSSSRNRRASSPDPKA